MALCARAMRTLQFMTSHMELGELSEPRAISHTELPYIATIYIYSAGKVDWNGVCTAFAICLLHLLDFRWIDVNQSIC